MARVLVSDWLAPEGMAVLADAAEVVDRRLSREELLAAVVDCDALVARVTTKVDRELIDAAPLLRVVGMPGTGLNHIDVGYARDRGIKVVDAATGNTQAVTELTIGLMLAAARRIGAAHAHVTVGRGWNKYDYQGLELAGHVLGIVGFGRIGRRVANLGGALMMEVIASDVALPHGSVHDGATIVGLEELLSRSDFVSLHVPLMSETSQLINKERLAWLKPGSYLINCARGELVDELAVAEALHSGHLAGLATDVLAGEGRTDEPVVDSPLVDAPNVTITPHIGAWTREGQRRCSIEVAKKIVDILRRG